MGIVGFLFVAASAALVGEPFGLTAQRMTDPVGLGTARPGLSWKLPSGVVRQTAYEIEADGQPCGKVVSDRQLDVAWPGRDLGSSDRASWRVRIWNERDEASAWSPKATFTTGLLSSGDWQAKWIGANPQTVPEADFGSAVWLEGTNFTARFASDRILDLALGATKPFRVEMNGRLVYKCDGHVFDYRHLRFLDLRPYLTDGENSLTVLLEPDRFDRQHDPSVAAAIAVLRDAGRKPVVASDATWGGRALGALRAPDFAAALDCREELVSPAFEKAFRVKAGLRRATLHVTGVGFYEALLNGRKVGEKQLDPSPTDYSRRVLYSTYLLENDLRAGENVLTLRLGHGWYDMRSLGMWNYDGAPWRDRPKGVAQLVLEYADGSRETVVTDASWRQVGSPVLYDCIREGATMGTAAAPDGLSAAVVPPPAGALEAEELPASKVVRELAPTEITADGPGRWIVTFPETVSGWVRLTARGLARGAVVSVEYDENLAPGRRKPKASPPNHPGPWTDEDRLIDVYFIKSGSYRLACGPGTADTDRFVASGAEVETFEPGFAYHGFRHVVLEGLAAAPSAADIRACHVRTAFPETGAFACSDVNLTELVRLAQNSYKVNFANGFPTDCPHREKLGWTGDAWIASELAQCYFENTAAYRKWLTDVMDTQTEKGSLCGICPTSGWGFAWGNGPVFDAVLAMLPWNLWLFRGDRIALEAAYPALLRYLAYEQSIETSPGLVANGLDDWNAKEESHKPTPEYVISCLRLEIVETAAKIADALGRTADAADHRAAAERIRAALRAKYAKGDGVFDNGGQTAQAMAVACRLAEGPERAAAAARLADSVLKTDCHADFGLVGAKYVYRALADTGRADLAYRMIVNPTEPTMMKWIGKNGTLWEDWTFGYSKSHIMLGDFSAWAIEYVAGLRRPLAAGYRQALIEPVLLPGLTWARGETETPYGKLASSWKLAGRDFFLTVTVPPGCVATVRLPDGSEREAEPGTHDYACRTSATEPVDLVNTGIGSVSHMLVPTFRTVQRPHAMFRFNGPAGQFTEDRISDIWLQNPGHRDSPVFSVRPLCGEVSGKWFATWDQEHATPYSYDLYLDSCGVKLSVAPGEKAAIATFAFERDGEHVLSFGTRDARGAYAFADGALTGTDVFHGLRDCAAKVYLFAEFDPAPAACETRDGRTALVFGSKPETVKMRLAVSYISSEQAQRNLRAEVGGWDAAALAADARTRWNDVLSQVEVEGGTEDERRVFYTALWRCHERMVNITEGGRYYGFDGQVHAADGTDQYTDDWIWDTFRAAHPLMTILNPKEEGEKLASYVRMAEQDPDRWMPVFPGVAGDRHSMVNRHYTIMFLDAWRKGIRGFDAQKAFALMDRTEETESLIPWHRGPLTELDRFYKEHGYYPGIRPDEKEWVKEVQTDWERRQCVSVTQGASYDAWALAAFGREIGIPEECLRKYDARAKGYAKLWNPKTQFFHPKDKDGNFIEPFDYLVCGGYGARNYFTENNAWTYVWDVQHDLEGLKELFGGGAAMAAKLDAMLNTSVGAKWKFTGEMPDGCTGLMGAFTMANEPAFHIPYLYSVAGEPWKTQKFVRKTLEAWFRNDRMGMCGDEDGGGMSAYAVFSMMGFYPVTPGKPEYVWGSPVFTKVTIHQQDGRDFVLEAPNASADAKYVRSISVNGVAAPLSSVLRHADIVSGARVSLQMDSRHD